MRSRETVQVLAQLARSRRAASEASALLRRGECWQSWAKETEAVAADDPGARAALSDEAELGGCARCSFAAGRVERRGRVMEVDGRAPGRGNASAERWRFSTKLADVQERTRRRRGGGGGARAECLALSPDERLAFGWGASALPPRRAAEACGGAPTSASCPPGEERVRSTPWPSSSRCAPGWATRPPPSAGR